MGTRARKYKILIIEDDSSIRWVLINKFHSEGFITYEAQDGEAGLAMALRKQPDIILLDLLIPKMDGHTVLKKLREENAYGQHVPVMVLSNMPIRNKEIRTSPSEPSFMVNKMNQSLEGIVKKVRK